MKRFIKCKKQLSNNEARTKIACLQQQITLHNDNITYWQEKIGKELTFIDKFILGTDKMNSPEDFIKNAEENLEYIKLKINDYKRFLTEDYKWFIY